MANVSKKQNQNRAKIKRAERVLEMKINVRGAIGQNVRAASDSGRLPVFALIS